MTLEDLQGFAGLAMVVCIILFFAARSRKGKPSSFTLLEYQKGILYSRGLPVRELGTGRHTVWLGTEKIIWLDVRPSPVNFERLNVALATGGVAFYGFFAQTEIIDLKKAIYAARNPAHASQAALMRGVRASLHRLPAQQIASDPEGAASVVRQDLETRLADSGFRLESFRFTQLVVRDEKRVIPDQASTEPKQLIN